MSGAANDAAPDGLPGEVPAPMMRRLLTMALVCAVVALPAEAGSVPRPRVVGGTEVGSDEFPFLVALIDAGDPSPYDGQFCGGTLIDPEWVLTAGHCVDGETTATIDVYVNDYDLTADGDRIDVAAIHRHPEFDGVSLEGDVALLHLATPATLTPGPNDTVRLATGATTGRYEEGALVTVAGWGKTEQDPPGTPQYPDRARKVDVPMQSLADCGATYAGFTYPHMVCAGYDDGGADSCSGDSGGPLFIAHGDGTYLQVGIVSWGTGCADAGYFGVYTRVATFACWIAETVDNGTLGYGRTTTEGGAGPDVFAGTSENDIYLGWGGADTISGGDGDDVLCGGDGADLIGGGPGADIIDGGDHGDTLEGGDGQDTMSGGSGADTLIGHRGMDGLVGGDGDDWIEGRKGSDYLDGADGFDDGRGGPGDDDVRGGDDDDDLRGGSGDDLLRGGAGGDDLRGNDDDDDLRGGSGFDLLDGGDGTDLCDGESITACEI